MSTTTTSTSRATTTSATRSEIHNNDQEQQLQQHSKELTKQATYQQQQLNSNRSMFGYTREISWSIAIRASKLLLSVVAAITYDTALGSELFEVVLIDFLIVLPLILLHRSFLMILLCSLS